MDYKFNEGIVRIPDDWSDETLNILKAPESDGCNLVVNRSRVPSGQTAEEYLEEQLKQIRDNLGGYREQSLERIQAGGRSCPLLDFTWSSPEGRMYQLNMMWVSPPVMLSFTFSSMRPFSQGRKKALASMLETVRPWDMEGANEGEDTLESEAKGGDGSEKKD